MTRGPEPGECPVETTKMGLVLVDSSGRGGEPYLGLMV